MSQRFGSRRLSSGRASSSIAATVKRLAKQSEFLEDAHLHEDESLHDLISHFADDRWLRNESAAQQCERRCSSENVPNNAEHGKSLSLQRTWIRWQ